MNDRKELEQLEFLIRTLNGENNVIEHMEKEGQCDVIKNTKLAKEMYPSREDWEQIGFIFTDIPDDDVLCNAILPNGWSIKETDHPMSSNILDENGEIRGTMFYKSSFYDRRANMKLERRYNHSLDYEYIDDNWQKEIVFFGNEQEKLFIAGELIWPRNINMISEKELSELFKKCDELRAKAQEFAEQYYPDWQNVHAYWEKSKEESKKLIKAK